MSLFKKLYHWCTDHKWELGFVENSLSDILDGAPLSVNWVKHDYHDRWFADPFILKYDETQIVLLVEEFDYNDKLGKISRLLINRENNRIVACDTVLKLDTHLSFPVIRRVGDDVFICPENSVSKEWAMYHYNDETLSCEKVETLIKQPLTDAVLFERNGAEYIFSTQIPTQNGNELSIYKKEDGRYKLCQSIMYDENIARMAGDIFEYNGKMYRPAQESNELYGHAISLQELNVRADKFETKEVVRLYSPSKRLNIGMHTFNVHGNLIVVDAKGFRRFVPGVILSTVKNMFKHLSA
jgi:hypothetical protein